MQCDAELMFREAACVRKLEMIRAEVLAERESSESYREGRS